MTTRDDVKEVLVTLGGSDYILATFTDRYLNSLVGATVAYCSGDFDAPAYPITDSSWHSAEVVSVVNNVLVAKFVINVVLTPAKPSREQFIWYALTKGSTVKLDKFDQRFMLK